MSQQDEADLESDADRISTNGVWTAIADDIEEIVAGEADIRVYEVSDDNIELEILPTGIGNELEDRHADISTTVHGPFQIVISRE